MWSFWEYIQHSVYGMECSMDCGVSVDLLCIALHRFLTVLVQYGGDCCTCSMELWWIYWATLCIVQRCSGSMEELRWRNSSFNHNKSNLQARRTLHCDTHCTHTVIQTVVHTDTVINTVTHNDTHSDTQWPTVTHSYTQWYTVTHSDIQWYTVIHNKSGLQAMRMQYRVAKCQYFYTEQNHPKPNFTPYFGVQLLCKVYCTSTCTSASANMYKYKL